MWKVVFASTARVIFGIKCILDLVLSRLLCFL